MTEFFKLLFDLLRHLGVDEKWAALLNHVGHPTLYATMFAIIFAETGLVILPFLPGDSLIFAIGAIGAREGIGINLWLMGALLIIAAVIGDAVNYWIGYKLGPAVFSKDVAAGTKPSLLTKLLNKEHLLKAQAFYEKYGAKTIILARFVPIVRTFAPFVAGVGKMNYGKFFLYNVVGGIAWVLVCLLAGKFFGGFAFVKKNFELVVLAIIFISVLPVVIEFLKARAEGKRQGTGFDVVEATTFSEKSEKKE